MSAVLAVAVGVLLASGMYLIQRRDLVRVVIGLGLLTNGLNLVIVAGSGLRGRAPPLVVDEARADQADPLAHALVLTAIVISFGLTALLLALGRAIGRQQGSLDSDAWQGTDDADGPEDTP